MVFGGFFFEVLIGVVGDKISRKLSVFFGFIIYVFGSVVFFFFYNFFMFFLYVFIFVLGVFFVSGSFEVWFFDDLKYIGREREYRKVMCEVKSIMIFFFVIIFVVGVFLV